MKKILLLIAIISFPILMNAQDWNTETGATTCFSSPRVTDLNGDGIMDIVVGGGIESNFNINGEFEFNLSDYGVMAFDGADGTLLWNTEANDQMFGSATFYDITFDGKKDVFIGGRNANLMALNGATGEIIWEFYPDNELGTAGDNGYYQFYTSQLVSDYNSDGRRDLLVANGGDKTIPSFQQDGRPPGKIMIISSVDGSVIAEAEVTDGQETYMSPLVVDPYRNGEYSVIFGTGGETVGGGLYAATIDEVLAGDLSGATLLASGESKGFIAPPTLADLTGDNVFDIVGVSFGGVLFAIDGRTYEPIWPEIQVANSETSASPTIGLFTDDAVPDIFITFGIGIAPSFSDFVHVMIDGATGEIVYEEMMGVTQFGTSNALDMDDDGFDEAILCVNYHSGNFQPPYSHEYLVIDFNDDTQTSLFGELPGVNIFSTPFIGDLGDDDSLDMIYIHNTDEMAFGSEDGVTINKVSLSLPDSLVVSFGGYMGHDHDAKYYNRMADCADDKANFFNMFINSEISCAGAEDATVTVNASECPCMASQCQYLWDNGDSTKHAYNLSAGYHYVTITHDDPGMCTMISRVMVEEPAVVDLAISDPSCVGESGMAEIMNPNIESDTTYVYLWSTAPTDTTQELSLENLTAGDYNVTISNANACEQVIDFTITDPTPIALETNQFNVDCFGGNNGSLSATAAGGSGSFTYIVGNDTTDNVEQLVLTDLVAGDYMVSAIDENGCATEAVSVSIEQPEEFTGQAIQQDNNCYDEENGSYAVDLSGGTGPFKYIWNGITSDPTSSNPVIFSGLAAGDYSVEFLDANDCSINFDFTITQPDSISIVVNVSQSETHQDSTANGVLSSYALGGTPPYEYQWNDEAGQTTNSAYDLPAGVYTVSVTDSLGCQSSTSIEVPYEFGVSNNDWRPNNIQVYPNPSKDIFEVNIANNELISWQVIDISGQVIKANSLVDGNSIKIDLSSYSTGLYLLELNLENQQIIKKLSLIK